MQLSSVREWKQRLLRTTRQEHQRLISFSVREAVPGRSVQMRSPTTVMALGVAPARSATDDYRLAVRIFEGQDQNAANILRQVDRYRSEVEIVSGVRYEPRGLTLRPGGSCGHPQITAGTLGAFVEDDQRYYLLSNNHVLANSDAATAGDPILQPGPVDIVDNRFHVIGHLHHWEPLSAQRIDAALATLSDQVSYFYPWQYQGIGQLNPQPIEDRFAVTRVAKRGRTTKTTRGRVSAFELDGVAIDYGTRQDPWVLTFDDQIEIVGAPSSRPFSAGGDSGSLIIDRDTLCPYALLYGGGRDADGIDRTLAHFIGDVLDLLRVRFVQ